ncbi:MULTISPECIES: GNAT family N-acetyltransferase [Streptomyces]|uniref:GNAT family N-acetyltransferase n=1 Tax=Streptomyces eurythermus TaxID=42237 RepID=A0ABW6Z3A7_9ACTN|nr:MULTISPECIES: GNAT family N-acetyltransferase [Streptomyces]QIS75250.1 GNAT family N-acetyltransferase [Streptomyces sp. DSM 40868]
MTGSPSEKTATDVRYRTPVPEDAVAVWRMVLDEPMLDDNSSYHYRLWFRDFAETSVVATVGNDIVGFLTGYRRPDAPDTFFIWQAAVKPGNGISGLGIDLLVHAIDLQLATGAKYVETSVSRENKAIVMLLHMIATTYDADTHTELLFRAEDLPGGDHDEVLHRIGPLNPRTA